MEGNVEKMSMGPLEAHQRTCNGLVVSGIVDVGCVVAVAIGTKGGQTISSIHDKKDTGVKLAQQTLDIEAPRVIYVVTNSTGANLDNEKVWYLPGSAVKGERQQKAWRDDHYRSQLEGLCEREFRLVGAPTSLCKQWVTSIECFELLGWVMMVISFLLESTFRLEQALRGLCPKCP